MSAVETREIGTHPRRQKQVRPNTCPPSRAEHAENRAANYIGCLQGKNTCHRHQLYRSILWCWVVRSKLWYVCPTRCKTTKLAVKCSHIRGSQIRLETPQKTRLLVWFKGFSQYKNREGIEIEYHDMLSPTWIHIFWLCCRKTQDFFLGRFIIQIKKILHEVGPNFLWNCMQSRPEKTI
jgi:hypothetical protein